jgi:hypothetical protein
MASSTFSSRIERQWVTELTRLLDEIPVNFAYPAAQSLIEA